MTPITRKSLLYKTAVEYGDYTINHIEGCAHGCRYPCYAMNMAKRFGRIKTYSDWCRPKLVVNALDLLKEELPQLKHKIKSVHLCFMSDPFMKGFPEVQRLTMKIIKLLNDNGIMVTTLTKAKYPLNLLDFAPDSRNEFGITLVSLDSNYKKRFEPFADKGFIRVRSLEKLHRAGARTWVSMEPYPTPNIISQEIGELLENIAFVDRIVFGRLNYNTFSTSYLNHRGFYNELAIQVMEFCQKNGIECHIKKGTLTGFSNRFPAEIHSLKPRCATV